MNKTSKALAKPIETFSRKLRKIEKPQTPDSPRSKSRSKSPDFIANLKIQKDKTPSTEINFQIEP